MRIWIWSGKQVLEDTIGANYSSVSYHTHTLKSQLWVEDTEKFPIAFIHAWLKLFHNNYKFMEKLLGIIPL